MRRPSGSITRGLLPVWADALRLGFGTLTAIRGPSPRLADKARAGWTMTFAPLVGAVLAALGIGVLEAFGAASYSTLGGFIVVGLLALVTRGMHVDGLADVADGLGAAKGGRPDPLRSLEVMRRGDVGPFGVVTVVVVLGLQASALGQLLASGRGLAALVLALIVSRFVLSLLCMRGVPAARTDGLGPLVAGSVGGVQVIVSALLAALLVTLLGAAVRIDHAQHLLSAGATLAALGAGIAVGVLFGLRCIHRFGGITGDVLGACVEVTFAGVLVVAALIGS
ncbi:MAG: adenosylcobinamide-GDP ribazoletransferase [Marmoricola sp.]